MKIISLVKMDKGRARICLDNGADFVLYKKEYLAYGIVEGGSLTVTQYNEIFNDILVPRCKKRAMHLLEKQDRSERNLRDKLRDGGYPIAAIDAAIAYLESFGYIDDSRVAASYIRFYQDSRSRLRIKQDLLKKGIKEEIILNCLDEEYEADETILIENLLSKRHYDKDEATYEEKAKTYRFLASKGFSSDAINKALS